MDNKLWTIEDGSLYWTDPTNLKWSQIGKEGEFKNITVMISGTNFLWMLDSGGTMYGSIQVERAQWSANVEAMVLRQC